MYRILRQNDNREVEIFNVYEYMYNYNDISWLIHALCWKQHIFFILKGTT